VTPRRDEIVRLEKAVRIRPRRKFLIKKSARIYPWIKHRSRGQLQVTLCMEDYCPKNHLHVLSTRKSNLLTLLILPTTTILAGNPIYPLLGYNNVDIVVASPDTIT